MLDPIGRQMSAKAGCRRQTLAVFFNILDLVRIVVWIAFSKKTNTLMPRSQFLFTLSEQLRQQALALRNSIDPPVPTEKVKEIESYRNV